MTWETLSNLEDKVEIEGGKDHTILPIVDMDSRDQTIQNTNNIKEMTPGLLPAEIELTVQELGTRITDERTRSSQRISKHPDWIHDFHLNACTPLVKGMKRNIDVDDSPFSVKFSFLLCLFFHGGTSSLAISRCISSSEDFSQLLARSIETNSFKSNNIS